MAVTTRMRWLSISVIAMILLLVASIASWWNAHDTESMYKAALKASRDDPRTAIRLTNDLLARAPTLITVRLLSARLHVRLREFDEAISGFELIPDDGSESAIAARVESGDVLMLELRQLSAAEQEYRRALTQAPNNADAAERLAFVLGLTARSSEAERMRILLLAQGRQNPLWLWLLSLGSDAVENETQLADFLAATPDDPKLLIASARIAIEQQRTKEADQILTKVLRQHPDQVVALEWQGRLLLDQERFDEFPEWEVLVGKESRNCAPIWSVRGFLAERRGQTRVAIRCFAESVALDPNLPNANYQLGQLLTQEGLHDSAKPFLERTRKLQNYVTAVKLARSGSDIGAMSLAASHAEELGLLWEADAWWKLILSKERASTNAITAVSRLKKKLPELGLCRTLPSANPMQSFDRAAYPLPSSPRATDIATSSTTIEGSPSALIRFDDRAASANLHFRYFNGAESNGRGPRMFEFTGGGVAVIDFDVDGWPDIYFAQGSKHFADPSLKNPDSATPNSALQINIESDRFFRNRGELAFEDVTELAGLRETSFSQGVTVGDYDNDGFADLFVANIGLNRLFRNNGDGTFADVSVSAGIRGNSWTTSCVMADLNGDSFPDIYAVNYLEGRDLFDRGCQGADGASHSCLPQQFAAADDQLLLNLGDGRFVDASADSGIIVADGKGLGVVAADFTGDGSLSLFVANDTTANFYFQTNAPSNGLTPRFQEAALAQGLALSGEGRAQACMGIACGDADDNGLLDLLVTNYYDESNTLYRQQPGGWFVDATRESKLSEPSYKMLGFGTQFLDADLDGQLDLAVANGHVDDFSGQGIPYQMRPQLFRNVNRGVFHELQGQYLGSYYSRPCLGRALATLDADCDGRPDMVITHLDEPAALLVNSTLSVGNSLSLTLCGVTSARDAIGATVTVKFPDRQIVRQLNAGDGYLASNERKLIIGVGAAHTVDSLCVRWPSGLVTTFYDVPSNHDFLLIEGQRSPIKRTTTHP